jgi:3,4-dehydroadipyl-CoA semialdehyde dehydrogenase
VTRLESYTQGRWQAGSAQGRPMVDPTTGETIGTVDATGIDALAAFDHARGLGGPALAALSFAERGVLIGRVADTLAANRAAYADIARLNSGNTKSDVAIDIDGGIGTLKFYARLAKGLGDAHAILEDGTDQLSRAETFKARHVWTTRPGVALHINAYNFPSWGLWEKIAVALLAGVPSIAKPASATAMLSERMVRDVVAANILPDGALQLVCGSGEGLVDALDRFDMVALRGRTRRARPCAGTPASWIARRACRSRLTASTPPFLRPGWMRVGRSSTCSWPRS